MPKYKLVAEHSENASVAQGEYFSSVFSGTVYDVSSSKNSTYFGLYSTNNGDSYTTENDVTLYSLSFELLNLNGEHVANLQLYSDEIKDSNGYIYGTLDGKIISFRMFAQDFLIRVTATINGDNPTGYGYSKQSILIKLLKIVTFY